MEKLKELMKEVRDYVSQLDIQGKENFDYYYYKDIAEIDKLVKTCKRCGKQFFPSINFKHHQKFCNDACRYYTTLDTAKKKRLDYKERQIDLLRKTIYQYRYQCNRDNITLSKTELKTIDYILNQLKTLRQNRENYTRKELANKVDELKTIYHNIRYV